MTGRSLPAPSLRAVILRRQALGLLPVAAPVLLVVALVLVPALSAVLATLRVEVDGHSVVSLANYADFFADPQSRRNLGFTLWTTAVATALLLALCLPLALYLRFATGRLPAVVQGIAVFPLFVPGIIVAYALIRSIGPNGLLATILATFGIGGYTSPYLGPWGPVIGLVWEGVPLTLLVLLSGLAQVPLPAIEAARDVGAGPVRILLSIILPLIRNSLLIAFALEFLNIFGAFTLPYLLGPASPEMMGVYMQRTFGDVRDLIAAQTQAVVTFLICAAVGVLYVRAISKSRARGAP